MNAKVTPGSTISRSEPAPPSAPRTLEPGPLSHPRHVSGAPGSLPEPRGPLRVMVVDDSAICLDATAMMLEESGYAVVTVESPFGLSSALTREQPDVVLVDVTMPGLSGDKLVEITLRNRAGQRRPLILLYSDRSEHELRDLAATCGAAGSIRKTSDAHVLARELQRYLRG